LDADPIQVVVLGGLGVRQQHRLVVEGVLPVEVHAHYLMRTFFAMLVIVAVGCSKDSSRPAPASSIEILAQEVEQERQSIATAVDDYVPMVKGQIDELASPTVALDRRPANSDPVSAFV